MRANHWFGDGGRGVELVIEPHRGIGPIRFGMDRVMVRDEMERLGEGRPRPRGEETDCYFGAAFQVSFGDEGLADFIELASSIEAEVWFEGLDVFDTPADELLAAVGRLDHPAPELSRPPQSYIFPGLILTLWGRDKQYDHRRGRSRPMFGAVGVGAPSYLAVIRTIRSGRGG